MQENIKIKMELFKPFILEENYKEEVYNIFLNMLQDIKQSKIMIDIYGKIYEVKARIRKERRNEFRYYKTLILEFCIDIDEFYDIQELDFEGKQDMDREQVKSIQKSCIISEIEKYIMDFTFAMNLAYPGFFEFNKATVWLDNIEYKHARQGVMLVSWIDVYINFKKIGWPVIHLLKFEQVWNWLKNRTNFMGGISITAIDRALNALTYTMGDSSYEQIFYVLLGIESIYNDNEHNGIVEQIRVKTETLLKRPEKFKKKISTFYNNRSKFIHGKLNFPNKYCPYDGLNEFQDFFFDKYVDTVQNAMAILIATIQEYILQDANKMLVNIVTILEK